MFAIVINVQSPWDSVSLGIENGHGGRVFLRGMCRSAGCAAGEFKEMENMRSGLEEWEDRMKRICLVIASIVLLTLGFSFVQGAVPPIINYQGKLKTPAGTPVADGVYKIQFAIYDVPVGGTPLWSEPNPSVQVKGGLLSVLIGSVVNLPANIFDSPSRFIGVKIGDDPELTPRQQVASVPFAYKAASAEKADNGVPVGGVIMWSGAVNSIPQGWALCNGTNGTPDLRNRFLVGAGDEYAVGATDGEKFHQLTVAEMPRHAHADENSANDCGGPVTSRSALLSTGYGAKGGFVGEDVFHTTGGNQPHENRPPYYALCFIMKVGS